MNPEDSLQQDANDSEFGSHSARHAHRQGWIAAARAEMQSLAAFDSTDLLTRIAALQLDPRNAPAVIRLTALTHCLVAERGDGSARMSRGRLDNLVNGGQIARSVSHLEDPPANPFVSCTSYVNGSYLYLPGPTSNFEFTLAQFLRAIGLHRAPFPDTNFLEWAHNLLLAALTLSNAMATKAGLQRYTRPAVATERVAIPDSANYRRLQDAVAFSHAELECLVSARGVQALQALIAAEEAITVDSYDPNVEPLDAHPIVRTPSGVLIADPSGLMPSAVIAVQREAARRGLDAVLAERYCDAVWHGVCQGFKLLGNLSEIIPTNQWQDSPVPCRECVLSVDLDKALYVLLLTDPMTGTDLVLQRNRMELRQHRAAITRRIRDATLQLVQRFPRLNEVDVLVLLQPCVANATFSFDKGEEPAAGTLAMTAAELEIVEHLCQGNSLVLRQYAEARSRIDRTTRMVSFSFLDAFGFYRQQDFSFYLDKPVNQISLGCDFELPLRLEVAEKRDWHGVVSPTWGVVDVARRWEDGAIPVYFAPSLSADRLNLLCEHSSGSIWVIGPHGRPPDSEPSPDLLDMIAYWIWQLSPDLTDAFAWLATPRRPVVIEVTTPDAARWMSQEPDDRPLSECLEITHDTNTGWYRVTLDAALRHHLATFDNAGERLFLQAFFAKLFEAAHANCGSDVNAILTSAIDKHAPLGPKKMLHFMIAEPLVGKRESPFRPPRHLQAAEEHFVLDDLAEYLRSKHVAQGRVDPKAQSRETLLNDCVAHLFQQIVREVAALSPDGLLEFLLAMNESVASDGMITDLTLANQLACFKDAPSLAKQYAIGSAELARTSISIRWLIEYIVASPPSGQRPVSMSAVDRLLALVSTMTYLGTQSDYIHHGVSDSTVTVLPTYRLAIEGPIDRAREAFGRRHATGTIRRRQTSWAAASKASVVEPDADLYSEPLDELSREEFGVSLSEYDGIVECLLQEFKPTHWSLVRVPRDRVAAAVADRLGITPQEATGLLTQLTLTPRSDFLQLPKPHERERPYPWKHGRAISYVRRPLVLRSHTDTPELLWGVTHLWKTPQYVRNLTLTGQLQPRSPAMRAFVGSIHEQIGRDFEARVRQVLQEDAQLIVKGPLKKVSSQRICNASGQDLGDIDALVAWPARKIMFVLECKDFSVARTPAEISNELDALFRDSTKSPCACTKHLRRAQWVLQHLPDTLVHMGIAAKGGWQVIPLLVTSMELVSTELQEHQIPGVTLTELEHDGLTELARGANWPGLKRQ